MWTILGQTFTMPTEFQPSGLITSVLDGAKGWILAFAIFSIAFSVIVAFLRGMKGKAGRAAR